MWSLMKLVSPFSPIPCSSFLPFLTSRNTRHWGFSSGSSKAYWHWTGGRIWDSCLIFLFFSLGGKHERRGRSSSQNPTMRPNVKGSNLMIDCHVVSCFGFFFSRWRGVAFWREIIATTLDVFIFLNDWNFFEESRPCFSVDPLGPFFQREV